MNVCVLSSLKIIPQSKKMLSFVDDADWGDKPKMYMTVNYSGKNKNKKKEADQEKCCRSCSVSATFLNSVPMFETAPSDWGSGMCEPE